MKKSMVLALILTSPLLAAGSLSKFFDKLDIVGSRDYQFASYPHSTDNNKELFSAVERGDAHMVQVLISKGADVNTKNKYRLTPLALAVKLNNQEMVKALIEQGADVTVRDDCQREILYYAIEEKNYYLAQLLIKKGANVNAKDLWGETVLHSAVTKNDFEMSYFLINEGADVNIKNSSKQTPLDIALINLNYKIIKLLLSKGGTYDERRLDIFIETIPFAEKKIFFRLLRDEMHIKMQTGTILQ